jgi:hypothetical protein
MPSVGFEPMIPVSERPKAHALDRAATGIGTAETCVGQKCNRNTQSAFVGYITTNWIKILGENNVKYWRLSRNRTLHNCDASR